MNLVDAKSAELKVEPGRPTASDLASESDYREVDLTGLGAESVLGVDSEAVAEPDDSLVELNEQLKLELVERYGRGERPTAAEYLERYPQLIEDRDRVVSLIYEEYCLREEHDEQPTPEEFCQRYDAWRDSLASQLRFHRLLSSVEEVKAKAPPNYPKPGVIFAGRFLLCGILGEGGTARVYLAEQLDVGNRRVALKVTQQLGREPAIQGRLNHPHIVPVWSVDRDEATGLLGLCMPFREGYTLDRVMKRVDPRVQSAMALAFWKAIQDPTEPSHVDVSQQPGWRGFPTRGTYVEAAAWIAMVIARALEHAHSDGALHRDVKPANLLLTSSEGPQLLDFNLADSPDDASNAQQAMQGGTLPYMAPEQLQAFLDPTRWARVGPAADVYSLGLVLAEMLTGTRPEAPRDNPPLPRLINSLLDQRARPHRSIRESNPAVPHGLAAIVAKCLSYETTDRYASAEQLAEDLERFLKRRSLRYAVNPCRRERTLNWLHRSKPLLAAVACLVLVGGLTAFTWAAARPDSQSRRENAVAWLEKHPTIKGDSHKARLNQIRGDLEGLVAASPDDYVALLNLGHIAKNFDRDDRKALGYFDRAIAVMEMLPEAPSNQWATTLLNRSKILVQLGNLAHRGQPDDDPAAARSYYLRTLEDIEAIREKKFDGYFRDNSTLTLRFVSAVAQSKLAQLQVVQNRAEAERLWLNALSELEQLDLDFRRLKSESRANDPTILNLMESGQDLRSKVEQLLHELRSDSLQSLTVLH